MVAQAQAGAAADPMRPLAAGRISADPNLGWTVRTGVNTDRYRSEVLEDGTRRTSPAPAAPPAILLIGDSFTFGDEVDDADTWAWKLSATCGRPIQNAGVLGYGLDQAVLRYELHPQWTAPIVVVSINQLMVLRTSLHWDTWLKPVFELDRGALLSPRLPLMDIAETPRQRPWLATADLIRLWYERLQPDPMHRDDALARVPLLLDRLREVAATRGAVVHAVWFPLPPELNDPVPHPSADDPHLDGPKLGPLLAPLHAQGGLVRGTHWSPAAHDVVTDAMAAWLCPPAPG
jgi:hypothetical protein